MAFEHVLVDDGEVITQITLNRPDRRNALSLPLMRELQSALEQAHGRVVVIAGAGPAFSAGHDLTELAACEGDDAAELFDTCASLMTSVQSIPQPVIAKVHGVATAAGCQLVASCDLAIAEIGARFATPGVRIGLFCSTPMVPLTRAIGPKRAMHMLLTGDLIDAATAIEWGLINDAVPIDELDAAVAALADHIAEASPMVLALGKRTFYEQVGMPQGDVYALAAKVMTENAATDDAHEGIQAFLEKATAHLDRALIRGVGDPHIRGYQPSDLEQLYEICLRTGDAGADASDLVVDPRLFGEVYAAPYGVLEPEHALVLDDGSGTAIGYALGALDTRAFEARCESVWWPPLRERHPRGSGGNDLDELLIAILHERHFAADATVAAYPSHLHIDLLPEAQGAGWGRRLMAALQDVLGAAGSPGVHLGVSGRNQRALGFYRHLGYEELQADAVGHTMALRLSG